MGNDTGRMPAAANDGSGGSTAGGSPDAAPYATPSFAHGIVPFDHEISSNQHLTFSYAEQSFASANIPWDPDHDALHLKERGMFTNTALIISDQCPFTIKCATFDGDVKAPISERIELSGSMIRQLNDAMTFLNGHNRRDDGRQCPPDALREALVNA
ncbi:transcriptional regulator, partial [Bifidobacterium bifidum]